MKKTLYYFDSIFRLVSEILMSMIRNLAPFMTAVLPGFFFGFTIGVFVYEMTGNIYVAGFIGFSAFVVLESSGIWSGHEIAEYIDRKSWKLVIPIITFIMYEIIGISTLWLLDSLENDIRIVGTAVFLLAGVIYILFGLHSYQEKQDRKEQAKNKNELAQIDIEKDKEEERRLAEIERERKWKIEDEQREEDRKLKLKEANAKNKLELEKLRLNGEIARQRVEHMPMPETTVGRKGKAYRPNPEKLAKLKKWRNVPNMNKQKLAEKIGVSRPTLDKYLDYLDNE